MFLTSMIHTTEADADVDSTVELSRVCGGYGIRNSGDASLLQAAILKTRISELSVGEEITMLELCSL